MQGGPPPFVVCPRCTTVMLGGMGYCPRCGLGIGFAAPAIGAPAFPYDRSRWYDAEPTSRWWRRTRGGLAVSAIGLFLVWLPWLSLFGALFISIGSSLLFLGARAAGRPHRVAVTLSFLAFAVGALIILFLLGAFLLHAYQIAGRQPMVSLRSDASTLQWGSLPGTAAIILGLTLQVNHLLRPRDRRILYGLAALLMATAFIATALAEPELAALDGTTVQTGPVLDFLSRLSVYRIVEAPAYVGLAIVYLFAHRHTLSHVVRGESAAVPDAP